MSSFLISVAVAVATGAALYYFFMHLQRINQKVDALGLHMRKLEGLVWAYNIRGHQSRSMHEDESEQSLRHPDSEDSEDELRAEKSRRPAHCDIEQHEESEHEESEHEEHVADNDLLEHVRSGSIFSFGMPVVFSQAQEPVVSSSRVEEVHEEAPLPQVVSFDAFNAAASRSAQFEDTARDEQHQQEDIQREDIQREEEQGRDTEEEKHEEHEDDEQEDDKHDKQETKAGEVRVYADTYANRKLGRVGKPY